MRPKERDLYEFLLKIVFLYQLLLFYEKTETLVFDSYLVIIMKFC